MKTKTRWSRRAFLQGIGYASSVGALNRFGIAHGQSLIKPMAGFAYVGTASEIHSFAISGNRWTLQQSVASKSPSFLALHPNRQYLYAVNEIDEHQGLPCGTIEAYKVGIDGTLELLNRQPLSLSGIRPRHLTISPDGSRLVVAVHGGGAYNVLPIHSTGELGRVTGILKEVGAGQHPGHQRSAHPHTVIFDSTGRYIVSTDQGCDRLHAFTLQGDKLVRSHQIQLRQGAGHMAMHVSAHGSWLYVLHASDGSVAGYRLDASGETLFSEGCCTSPSLQENTWMHGALTISSSGDFLYASDIAGVTAWKRNAVTGELTHVQRWSEGYRSLRSLSPLPHGRGLIAVDNEQGRVLQIEMDEGSGRLRNTVVLAEVAKPASLTMKFI